MRVWIPLFIALYIVFQIGFLVGRMTTPGNVIVQ